MSLMRRLALLSVTLAASLLGCACGGMDPQVIKEVSDIGPWPFTHSLEAGSPDPPLDPGEYLIGPGDEIEIETRDSAGRPVEDACARFPVPVAGHFVLPYVGRTKVAGRMVGELTEYYRKALADREVLNEPRVEVFVNRYRSRTVLLSGAVRNPGPHPLPDTERRSLRVFVLAAGGVQDSADVSRIEVFRPSEIKRYAISWWDMASSDEKFFLEPGDQITVPAADPITVKGEVVRQGEYPFEGKKTTFLRVIQAAGLTKFSDHDPVHVRRREEGRLRDWEIDYDCIDGGDLPDFVLRPGDVIEVESGEVSWLK